MLSRLTRTARWFAPVCVIFAAASIALVGPGAASAERLAKCTEGTKVNGEGSTLQKLAQKEVWGEKAAHAYNNGGQKNKAACPGGPEITYNTKGKTGSGKGMENWYTLEEYGPEAQGFAGTDNPPNADIKEKIEKEGTGGKVLTIPTLQAAIAMVINLPKNCTAEAEPKPGEVLKRLVLGEKTIEKILRRKITKWSQIKDGKDKLVGAGCVSSTELTRVVREDGSGTTATFKKSLELILGKAEKVVNGKTWLESAEEPPVNTEWPEEGVKLVRGNGNGGMVKKVAETPSSIGYIVLANARAESGTEGGFVPATGGGEGTAKFWAKVENGNTEKIEGKTFKKFIDPSDNGDANAKSKSNCEATAYVAINPATGKAEKGKFPPASTELLWNLVSAEKKDTNYPLCGLTYDLALTQYKGFKAASLSEATTVGDYLEWVLNAEAEGGQTLIGEETDYLGLPNTGLKGKNVLVIAQEGAKKIQF